MYPHPSGTGANEMQESLDLDALKSTNRYSDTTKSSSFLPNVHERQTQRMKTRSEWFLNPEARCDTLTSSTAIYPLTSAALSAGPTGTVGTAGGTSTGGTSTGKPVKRTSSKEKRLVRRTSSKKDKENGGGSTGHANAAAAAAAAVAAVNAAAAASAASGGNGSTESYQESYKPRI